MLASNTLFRTPWLCPLRPWLGGVCMTEHGVFGGDSFICQCAAQQWVLPGWLFNEFYDTLNLPDLKAI